MRTSSGSIIGKKRPRNGRPAGRYRDEYQLTRNVDGRPQVVIDIKWETELR